MHQAHIADIGLRSAAQAAGSRLKMCDTVKARPIGGDVATEHVVADDDRAQIGQPGPRGGQAACKEVVRDVNVLEPAEARERRQRS
eukprot:scaffold68346_cov47-Prasinocladus_malaysianus.AAC.2